MIIPPTRIFGNGLYFYETEIIRVIEDQQNPNQGLFVSFGTTSYVSDSPLKARHVRDLRKLNCEPYRSSAILKYMNGIN